MRKAVDKTAGTGLWFSRCFRLIHFRGTCILFTSGAVRASENFSVCWHCGIKTAYDVVIFKIAGKGNTVKTVASLEIENWEWGDWSQSQEVDVSCTVASSITNSHYLGQFQISNTRFCFRLRHACYKSFLVTSVALAMNQDLVNNVMLYGYFQTLQLLDSRS